MDLDSQIEGHCSVPIRYVEVAWTKPAQEQNSAFDNWFTLGFEPPQLTPRPAPPSPQGRRLLIQFYPGVEQKMWAVLRPKGRGRFS